MTRRRILVLLALLTLGLAAAGCGGDDTSAAETTVAAGDGTTLNGSVGPGFDIDVDGTNGIGAGSYTLVIDDRSSVHNFHFTGPGGVDVSTAVGAEGEQSFAVELQAGEYRFQCDPHASQMNGSFTVG